MKCPKCNTNNGMYYSPDFHTVDGWIDQIKCYSCGKTIYFEKNPVRGEMKRTAPKREAIHNGAKQRIYDFLKTVKVGTVLSVTDIVNAINVSRTSVFDNLPKLAELGLLKHNKVKRKASRNVPMSLYVIDKPLPESPPQYSAVRYK